MKNIIHSYFLLESDFEITFKKCKNLLLKISFFEGCVEKHTLPYLKGLSPKEFKEYSQEFLTSPEKLANS